MTVIPPTPTPINRSAAIAELLNLAGLFAQLQTSRIKLASEYAGLPHGVGLKSSKFHEGAADAYAMAQTFIQYRIKNLTGGSE